TNVRNFCLRSSSSQLSHVSSLSWQYVLLLPCCVWLSSSPWYSIDTPCENSRVAIWFRFCRSRRAMISGSSVGPSTPQFHELLSLAPSRLSSPLASLCLSL